MPGVSPFRPGEQYWLAGWEGAGHNMYIVLKHLVNHRISKLVLVWCHVKAQPDAQIRSETDQAWHRRETYQQTAPCHTSLHHRNCSQDQPTLHLRTPSGEGCELAA